MEFPMDKESLPTSSRPLASDEPSLQARIQQHYGELPESERKLADLILDFPGEVAAYSATELANLASASKAAVTRLTRRIGYESFEEARIAARDAKTWGSPVYLLSKSGQDEAFAERIQNHIDQDFSNLTHTLDGIAEETIASVVDGLATAPRIWLLGYRNSHFLAGYARWQFIQLRGDVNLLPAAGETMAEYLAELAPEDMLLVIGFRRRVPETELAMKIAARVGTRVVFVTDPTAHSSPYATWTLRCELHSNNPFDSYVSAISLLHFLSVALIERMDHAGRERLTQIEGLHQELYDFG
jgi:DNA-binding MurR/RpiR family transcriptional regulator